MEIEIIPLAKKKIEQRGIPYKWIEQTIKNPEKIAIGYGGREVRQRVYMVENRPKLLRIVVEKEDDKIVVVTAYLTSKIEKYGGEI